MALKRPSAILPVVMSVVALAVVLGHVALFGAAREPDEGAAAHVFQLLIAGQLPFIVFFAIRWLPKDRRAAMKVLALQAAAVLVALAPVYYFHL